MRAADFHCIDPALPPAALPIHIRQSASRVGAIGTLAFVAPGGLALLAPFAMLGHALATDIGVRQTLVERPASATLLAVGLVVWCALLALPLQRSLAGLARFRRVAIANGRVTVEDRGLTGSQTWSEPIGGYVGLMHLVRTNLSSSRHELVLVHPDRARTVLVAVADQISEQQIGATAALLGTRVLPSSLRYARPAAGWMSDAAAVPLARAA